MGDIHGCYRSLDALASFAGFDFDDRIVTLGDYIDRGPDSRRVI
ncbi:MAG: metallophosphoesterase, partial [Planctomycetota bacterium]